MIQCTNIPIQKLKRNIQELPKEILLHMVEYIPTNELIGLSETSTYMNRLCHTYMVHRWDIASSTTTPTEAVDSESRDGLIQRLQREDPKRAHQLYQQYIQGDDEDETSTKRKKNSRSMSTCGVRIFPISTTQMIQYQKFTLLPVVVTIVFWPAICTIKCDFRIVANVDTMTLIILLFWSVILSSITMFVGATALFGTQSTQKAVHDNDDDNDKNFTPNSRFESVTSLRRSYSQPEFMSFASPAFGTLDDASIIAHNNMHKTNIIFPTRQKPLNRCLTVASSSLSSFGDINNCYKSDQGGNLSSHTRHPKERALWPEANLPTTVVSLDHANFTQDEELGTFMFWDDDDEGDEMEVGVAVPRTEDVVNSTCYVTMVFRNEGFFDPAKNISSNVESSAIQSRTKPRGWIGLYHRAMELAKIRITNIVKDSRVLAYKQLNMNDRNDTATSLMNACTINNDNSASAIQLLSKTIPTQDFYIGADGTETCALHIAAFHGSSQVIDFLCRDIDTACYFGDKPTPVSSSTVDSASFTYSDGGLCDVNATDANGWTALHYAIGTNSVDAVRALLKNGASLNIPAENGYTPLQWAVRLQHHTLANELRDTMAMNRQNPQSRSFWLEAVKRFIPTLVIPVLLIVLVELI